MLLNEKVWVKEIGIWKYRRSNKKNLGELPVKGVCEYSPVNT